MIRINIVDLEEEMRDGLIEIEIGIKKVGREDILVVVIKIRKMGICIMIVVGNGSI